MTTAPALACPRHLQCFVQAELTSAPEIARVRKVAAIPDVRTVHVATEEHFTFGDAPRNAAAGEIEMPWFWRVLREHVVSRLPSYREPDRFTIVLSPVVVTTPSDTIPGVGIAGNF